ncbi:MAG: DNA repair protein [Coriobacteriaceae bacterium]|nr:DNA repair protein [Coriobacteriaceae bacterium]
MEAQEGTGWERSYLCIDLKSFYASCECVERGLDPLTTDLVVADPERSDKTICLAVSPSLKAKGVRNRCRVFQIPQGMDYIMAPPRMALYIRYSARIYQTMLRFVSEDDIHVYSIDEAFLDVTGYLGFHKCSARQLGERIRQAILQDTGIPATCGLGSNLYLAKVALDITAKHSPDFFGVLDEQSYQATMWDHRPITDFWRVGPGTARRLKKLGLETMGQVALYANPERLYKELGIDAEILIDHAWGKEPVTIADIKAYRRRSHSLTNGQVLPCGYTPAEARIIVTEMLDQSCLDLVAKGLVASSVSLAVHCSVGEWGQALFDGATVRFGAPTNARSIVLPRVLAAYDHMACSDAKIHRVMITCNDVQEESRVQQSLFEGCDPGLERERQRQEAILDVKRRFGKNSLVRGTDLMPKATQMERNLQIGGHRSGEQ